MRLLLIRNQLRICFVLALLFVVGSAAASVEAQTKRGVAAKPSYKLVVKEGPVISLSSREAKLADIAADLAIQLKTKVVVSPILQEQPIKVDFKELPLEPSLQLLAPQIFIDYELGMDHQLAVGIFLLGYNEPPPSLNASVAFSSQALLVEGDTEDGVEPATEEARKREEEKPLRVKLQDGKLTIRARQQPVPLVVMKVADQLGIPAEIRDESREVLNAEIVGVPVEEAMQRISPNLRLYVRADLQRLQRIPFRVVLNPP